MRREPGAGLGAKRVLLGREGEVHARYFFVSVKRGVALLDEGGARLLRVGRGVELEGEALLEAVALLDVEELDPVQRLLGEA